MTTQNSTSTGTAKAMYDVGERHLFPQLLSVGGEVADFWSTVFLGAATQQGQYEQLVQSAIQRAGLKTKQEDVSFGQGVVLGKARPFLTIRRGSVTGVVHIGRIGEALSDVYVSLRVLFVGTISSTKTLAMWALMTFFAAFPSLLFFIPLWGYFGFLKTDCSYGNCYYGGQVINTEGGLMAYLLTLAVLSVLFVGALRLWSWWRYGDAEALVREDLDELHRDDISALGHELYVALNSAADQLALQRLTEEPPIPPSFGVGTQTNRTRKRRI